MKKYKKEAMKGLALFLVMTLVMALAEPAAVSVRAENAVGELAGDAESGYYIHMPATGTTELMIPENVDTFKVYDNGGKDGVYSNGCDGYLLLTAPQDYVFNFAGTVVTEGATYDWLTIYDGSETGCDYIGENAKNGNTSGAQISLVGSRGNQVLLYFRSDGSNCHAGIDLNVTLRKREQKYSIISAEEPGGYLTFLADGEPVSSVSSNEMVTVAATPAEGYDLVGVEAKDSYGNTVRMTDGFWYTDNTGSFLMPSTDVVVKGIFQSGGDGNEISQTMPVAGTKELKIAPDVKKFKVYTDCGKGLGYSNNCSGYLLLTAPEGYIISLYGTVNTEHIEGDYLRIYDGNSAESELLGDVSKYGSSTTENVEFLTSKGNQVLLHFVSDGSYCGTGADLTVTLGAVNAEYVIAPQENKHGNIQTYIAGHESATAHGGEEVTVVGTPKEGYALTGMEVTDSYGRSLVVEDGFWYTDNTGMFVMPADNVKVKCTFTDVSDGADAISETIPVTGTKELKIARDIKEFKVYTSGGSAGGYGHNGTGCLLLTAPEDYIMKLEGTCVTESVSLDWLTIYDGNVQDAGAIVGSTSTYGSPDHETVETIVSSKNQMLLYFRTDHSNDAAGVNLTVKLSNTNERYALETETTPYGKLVFQVDGKQVSEAAEFKTVSAVATPTEGYMLTGMQAVDGAGNRVELCGGAWHNGNKATFLMPANTVKVYPEYKKIEDMADEMYQNLPQTGAVSIEIPREIRTFHIYDDGGAFNNYSDNCNTSALLTVPQGYLMRLTGILSSESLNDRLTIYDGSLTSDAVLGGAYGGTGPSGNGIDIGTLTSSGNQVLLTYVTDGSVTNVGFGLKVELVPIEYEIAYELGNGALTEGEENPAFYTADDEIRLTNPVREGYVFGGWTGTGLTQTMVDVVIPIGSYGERAYIATWLKPLTHEDMSISVENQTYTGMFEDPVTVKDGETVLERDVDYSVTYKKGDAVTGYPTDAGTYEVTIVGLGSYTGTVKKEFVSHHVQLTLVSLTAIDREYNTTDEVTFSDAVLSGIVGTDMVQADLTKLRGTISSAVCGEYAEVTLEQFPLIGESAHNYTVRIPEGVFTLSAPMTISKAENVIGKPAATMSADYLTKTVGEVKLPKNWIWKASDATKALVVSKAVTATAEYVGADKDNYENASAVIAITRRPCTHMWNSGVITIEPTAVVKGKKTYTCNICKATKNEDIPAKGLPKTGATATDAVSGMEYKVTKATAGGGTVEITKPADKKVTSVTIPDAVVIDGVTYQVTSIAKNAFSGCSKLKEVIIGANVNKIGAKAFYKCKKLKKLTIKTTKLTAKKVGKQAFEGTPKKMTLKVPKKKMKLYKKVLKTKGVNKKAKYKKL